MSEVGELEKVVSGITSPVVFSHNDLLLGNCILSSSEDRISFIDFEYGAWNYQGFDIANHFNEYAGMVKTFPYNFLYWILG